MKEQPKKQQEDLLAQIRSQYEPELGLEGMSAAKMKDGWLLSRDPESEAGYALWEVHKDPERVRLALAWQEQVKAKGCAEVLTIRKTSQGESFIRREEGVFYLTEWVAGTPPEMDKEKPCRRWPVDWRRCINTTIFRSLVDNYQANNYRANQRRKNYRWTNKRASG